MRVKLITCQEDTLALAVLSNKNSGSSLQQDSQARQLVVLRNERVPKLSLYTR